MNEKEAKGIFRTESFYLVCCPHCRHSNSFSAFDIDNELILKCQECGHIFNTHRKGRDNKSE